MKKTLQTTALLLSTILLPGAAGAAGNSEADILKRLEDLTQMVISQQKHIEALESKLVSQNSPAPPEVTGQNSKIKLANSAIDQLKIKADLRLRYELRERDRSENASDSRNRFRSRVRIGGIWQNKVENWEAGIGLASGGSDAVSTNITWSETKVFETSDIRLDYAYVKHNMGAFSITAGQHINPYKRSWVYWDGDVRPTGVSLHYGEKMGPFVTAGAYGVRYYGGTETKSTNNTGMMGAGQVGWNGKIGSMTLLATTGLQYWESSVAEDYYTVGDDYNFTILDAYTKLSIPVGDAKIDLYAQVWENLGADGDVGEGVLGGTLDPEDETTGFNIGGVATVGNFGFKASYTYIEADSLFVKIKDGSFGSGLDGGTNVEGVTLGARYNLTKNWNVRATAYFYETIEEYNDGSRDVDDDADLYQFDLNYKF